MGARVKWKQVMKLHWGALWQGEGQAGVGGGREVKEGDNVRLWLIHTDVWQEPTQYYKAIICQLKTNLN